MHFVVDKFHIVSLLRSACKIVSFLRHVLFLLLYDIGKTTLH